MMRYALDVGSAARSAVCLALLLAAACGGTRSVPLGRPAPAGPVLFPAPPDTPRIQFLAAFTSAEDVTGKKRRSLVQSLVGEEGEKNQVRTIVKPYGITLFRGRLYVCDTMLPGVEILDLRARTFEQFTPGGAGRLRKPINCAIDRATGRLFVADTERGQVVVFDSLRNYVGAIGEAGARPADVFVDDTGIWVADLATRTVRTYERGSFRLLSAFPDSSEVEGRLTVPANLWVEADQVYVSDVNSFTVKVFDRRGRYLRSIGNLGLAPGQFARPKGVAVDRSGRVYVVDAATERVQVFNHEGQLLMFFGGPYQGPGDLWLPAKVTISYDDLDIFGPYLDPRYEAQYLILVTSQYGPDRVSVYAFLTPRGGAPPR